MAHHLRLKDSGPADIKMGGQRLFVRDFGEDGTFEGYGSVFGVKDSYSEVVAPGAFAASLKQHKADGTYPALLWQHDPSKPIGVYTSMREDEKGLLVKGKLALDTQLGKEAYSLLKMGGLNGLSIGFMPVKSEVDEKTGVRSLTEIDLWEVSLVTFPANGKARVEGVKSDLSRITRFAELERHLRDVHGLSNSEATAIVAKCKEIDRRFRDEAKAKSDIKASADRLLTILNS